MLENTGYGPSVRRRGSGNMLTHAIMAVLGAALAAGLLLAFYNPTSGGISMPGSGAVPAPGPASGPLTGGEQAIVTKVKPGLVIINTTLQYDSEAAAGTGMVINADGLVLTNNHVNGGFSSGTGTTPRCYTSNSGLTVPSTIAPASSGALIIGTICGSPAASAGMTGGAVITAVNAQTVSSPDDLAGILSRFHPGDTISVTWVSPSGQRTTSSLHLTAGPPQ
jgi:S1-C subfamily serine protease